MSKTMYSTKTKNVDNEFSTQLRIIDAYRYLNI